VKSSPLPVAIIHDVGRSSATTRTRRAEISAFNFSQSAVVKRDNLSTCNGKSALRLDRRFYSAAYFLPLPPRFHERNLEAE
jgi:hypothetical protein